jgi:hypothetical protein
MSVEAGVMPVERREQVTRIRISRVNGQPEELEGLDGRRQPSLGGTSRISREVYVRFCERLGVQFPGPTRPKVGQGRVCTSKAKAFSFTHRTKVIAGGTVRKNSA